ncbi:MAG: hypothetical protein HY721_07690 [Planctomycetes bacterium]|nr:hypothetical protein [Planctomycetota bacterium]
MPYVTSFERIGIKKGRRVGRTEGRAEGLEEAIEAFLRSRFGRKGLQLLAHAELPQGRIALRRLLERLFEAPRLGAAAALIGKVAARGRKRP